MADSEIYVEFQRIGQVIKVTAIDSKTGIEIVTQGPIYASEAQLKKVACDKLRYRLEQLAKQK